VAGAATIDTNSKLLRTQSTDRLGSDYILGEQLPRDLRGYNAQATWDVFGSELIWVKKVAGRTVVNGPHDLVSIGKHQPAESCHNGEGKYYENGSSFTHSHD